jgi:Kef-type K+ transport system membrane component KefB
VSFALTLVEPPSGHSLLVFILQIGVLLLLAVLLGRLAQRLGMPAIVGELGAGVLLGPSLFANVAPGFAEWLFPQRAEQMHLLDAVTQLGVLLLVGLTGMHVDMRLIRRRGTSAAKVSLAGLIVPLGLGVWLGLQLPSSLRQDNADPLVFALFIGVAMSVSAIPVIARTLIDMKLIHRNIGQMILVTAMLSDAVGWLLVSVVTAMATTGLRAGQVSLSLLYLAGVVAFAATAGRLLVRWVMRMARRSSDRGVSLAVMVIMIVLSAAGTHALGLEAILGAFLCGILISSCKDVDGAALEPLNTTVLSVLAPLFFATVGLRMDLTALADPDLLLAALAVVSVAVVGKFLGAFLGAVTSRMNRWEALALGAGMNARGMVEVIIAMIGVRLGLLTTEMYTIVVLVAVLTSLMAPPLLRIAMNRVEHTVEEQLREHKVLAMRGALSPGSGP